MKVFISGEGRHELGKWDESSPHRGTSKRSDGTLISIARRVRSDDVTVVGGVKWSAIRKYRSGEHSGPEERAIVALANDAHEAGADALIFARDTDGEVERRLEIEHALAVVLPAKGFQIRVAGGCPEPCIEAWILALEGSETAPDSRSADWLKNKADTLGVGTEDAKVG